MRPYLSPMKALIDLILQFGVLNKQQTDFILSKAKTLDIKKDEYFSEAGKVPKHVGFVLEGVFRFCYYNNKGDEVTNYFVDEGNFVVDNEKFESQIVASEYIQAVTDCKILAFSKKEWDDISNTIVGFEMIKSNVVKKCLTLAMERRSPLVSEDASTRYLSFIQNFPSLVNRIPLSFVASYLGITQQSLSRIRRNIR
ncbi:CRP-like cAMP-binding protein [Pedobacter agri]|nr:CRP-like cAMP-binding protein [Pedobacter agri]